MGKFIIRRILWTLLVLLGVILLTFLLVHAIPGSPWDNTSKRAASVQYQITPAARRALDQRFGLDLPLWRQFTRYVIGDISPGQGFVCGAVCGNLGPSFRLRGGTVQGLFFSSRDGQPFWQSRFGYTMRLVVSAFVVAVLLGIPIGMIAAITQHSRFDRVASILMTLSISIPNFVVGLLAVIVFGSGLGWISVLPSSWEDPQVWVAPILILSVTAMGSIVRLTRSAMLEVMRQDYVRTARAKGLREWRVVTVHIMRNALVPVVTLLGPVWAQILTESFIIEAMFAFPGFGLEFWEAIKARDYPTIMGATLIYASLIVITNLIVDVLYGWLDPRIQTT